MRQPTTISAGLLRSVTNVGSAASVVPASGPRLQSRSRGVTYRMPPNSPLQRVAQFRQNHTRVVLARIVEISHAI